MTHWLDVAACRDVDPESFFPPARPLVQPKPRRLSMTTIDEVAGPLAAIGGLVFDLDISIWRMTTPTAPGTPARSRTA